MIFRNVANLVSAYSANSSSSSYEFLAEDFLFDINDIYTIYQDPFKETQVVAATNTVGSVADSLT